MSASVSTHVLDTARGEPAVGVKVELARDTEVVATAETDREGRVRELAAGLEPGRYELVFWPQSPFFIKVEVEVELGEGHHHIPLLISPYGCVTYRGS